MEMDSPLYIDCLAEFPLFTYTCDLIEEYFGEVINEIALENPISRPQLISILARVQLSGSRAMSNHTISDYDIIYQSDHEILLWLAQGFWTEVNNIYNFSAEETWAARKTHRQIINAIEGTEPSYSQKSEPLVLIKESFGISRNRSYEEEDTTVYG